VYLGGNQVKIGDRVRIIRDTFVPELKSPGSDNIFIGMEGTIILIRPQKLGFTVKFDTPNDSYMGFSFFNEDELEVIG
jgi:hypothetical protein